MAGIKRMGMTGCRKTMLRIVAYQGLKVRCIAVLLHTRMSHTGRTTSTRTSALRRPEWNGDIEPAGGYVYDNDVVHGHTQYCCQYDQVVDSRQGCTVDPLVDGLRSFSQFCLLPSSSL